MSPSIDDATRAKRAREADEDRELVRRTVGGDRSAFGSLVERYQKRVYAVAFGIVRDREDAWDVAQEAFVKAFKNLDRFEGDSTFFTWMYRITYNLAIDHYRSRGRRETGVDLDERGVERALQAEDRPNLGGDPDQMSDRAELSRVLHEAMGKLSDKHRAIIVLREVEGLSYEEIAAVLGIAKGTVMSRLFHARKNLQTLLRPYVEGGEAVPDNLRLAAEEAR